MAARFAPLSKGQIVTLAALAALPLADLALPLVGIEPLQLASASRTVVIFAVMALGLNIVVGWTGLLNLGIAAFAAVGAYAFGILTWENYPFQLGFWPGLLAAGAIGAVAGVLLGAPTLRLRGDYLAIVTLCFGEIVQDALKNLEGITKGTQGINPLPAPAIPAAVVSSETPVLWFYLYLAILAVVVVLCRNLEFSRLGRQWFSVREDELAARCMAIEPDKAKLKAFATGAALAAIAGALSASALSSTGEPANYDFSVSILALCIVIVGGIGSITGVLVGSIVMIGLSNVALPLASEKLQEAGIGSTSNVLTSPINYKYLLFGLALVVMMRYRPDGIVHSRKAVRK
ncbi:MAG: branched-chain amino acid ABC transporter permease [Planctomycetota bacterium]